MNELKELLRRMEMNEPGKLWEYGAIMEYVKDRIKELRRERRPDVVAQFGPRTERRTTAETSKP
jgi:hypothetical protein